MRSSPNLCLALIPQLPNLHPRLANNLRCKRGLDSRELKQDLQISFLRCKSILRGHARGGFAADVIWVGRVGASQECREPQLTLDGNASTMRHEGEISTADLEKDWHCRTPRGGQLVSSR